MATGRLLLLLEEMQTLSFEDAEENGVVLLEEALLRSFLVLLVDAVEVLVDAEALLLFIVLLFCCCPVVVASLEFTPVETEVVTEEFALVLTVVLLVVDASEDLERERLCERWCGIL